MLHYNSEPAGPLPNYLVNPTEPQPHPILPLAPSIGPTHYLCPTAARPLLRLCQRPHSSPASASLCPGPGCQPDLQLATPWPPARQQTLLCGHSSYGSLVVSRHLYAPGSHHTATERRPTAGPACINGTQRIGSFGFSYC